RNGGVATQTGALGAEDGRSTESLTEFFRRHFSEPGESGVIQPGPRLELTRRGCRSLTVPRTNILADVATENVVPHAGAKVLGDRPPFFNGEIGDALVGIELVRSENRVGRAGLDAASAGPTAVRSGHVGRKFERREDHTQEK